MFLNIFKIGGSIVDNDQLQAEFCSTAAGIAGKKLIVHGGGSTASAMCRQLGIDVKMHEGRRITDESVLKVVVMIYGGWINKRLVAGLQAHKLNALGLTGADCNSVQAHKRSGCETNYGLVGDIDSVNTEMLNILLDIDIVPVIAPITHDGNGQLLNTNADTMSAMVAGALAAGDRDIRLTYLFDKPGVLKDVSDNGSVIPEIALSEIGSLRTEGIIADGMLPKLDNARTALERGVREVLITDLEGLKDLDNSIGTKIIRD